MWTFFKNIFFGSHVEELEEPKSNVEMIDLSKQFNDGPYEFSVNVTCKSDPSKPYRLVFKPNSPFENNHYICHCCDADIDIKAIEIHPEYDDNELHIVPVRNRAWHDGRLIVGFCRHFITVEESCAKLTEDDFKKYNV